MHRSNAEHKLYNWHKNTWKSIRIRSCSNTMNLTHFWHSGTQSDLVQSTESVVLLVCPQRLNYRRSTHYIWNADFPTIQAIFHVTAHFVDFRAIFYTLKLLLVFHFQFQYKIHSTVILAFRHYLWTILCYFAHSWSKMAAKTTSSSCFDYTFQHFAPGFLSRSHFPLYRYLISEAIFSSTLVYCLLQSAVQYGPHSVKHVCIIWHHLHTEKFCRNFCIPLVNC